MNNGKSFVALEDHTKIYITNSIGETPKLEKLTWKGNGFTLEAILEENAYRDKPSISYTYTTLSFTCILVCNVIPNMEEILEVMYKYKEIIRQTMGNPAQEDLIADYFKAYTSDDYILYLDNDR